MAWLKGFLSTFFFLIFASTAFAADPFAFLIPYNALLKAHVMPASIQGIQGTAIDYKSWAKDRDYPLTLQRLLASDTSMLTSREQKMAFWLNAYNFITIHLILREKEQDSIRNLGGLFSSPWKKHKWHIGNQTITLHGIEHDILRPMGDARIHFAINCASLSCPDLRREAYRPEMLHKQLEDQTVRFLNNPTKGFRLEKGNRYINAHISKIFDWFDEDFLNGDVRGWLKQHLDLPGQIKTSYYIDYNWKLNALPGRTP